MEENTGSTQGAGEQETKPAENTSSESASNAQGDGDSGTAPETKGE